MTTSCRLVWDIDRETFSVLPVTAASLSANPVKEKTSTPLAGTDMRNRPSRLVVVPVRVPFTNTFTPDNGELSLASVTTPDTSCCAQAKDDKRMAKREKSNDLFMSNKFWFFQWAEKQMLSHKP
jgi:hypothetical protein